MQEVGQGVLSNLAAGEAGLGYDPERGLLDGTVEGGAAGGVTGFLANVALSALSRRMGRANVAGPGATPDVSAEATTQAESTDAPSSPAPPQTEESVEPTPAAPAPEAEAVPPPERPVAVEQPPDAGEAEPAAAVGAVEAEELAEPALSGTQAVDKDGAPITLYHGTGAEFDAFDPGKRGSATGNPTSALGFSFTPLRSEAERYAKDFGGGTGRVVEVNLNLRNPKRLSWREFSALSDLKGDFTAERLEALREEAVVYREQLEAEGYDGIIVAGRENEHIAFYPEQVQVVSPAPVEAPESPATEPEPVAPPDPPAAGDSAAAGEGEGTADPAAPDAAESVEEAATEAAPTTGDGQLGTPPADPLAPLAQTEPGPGTAALNKAEIGRVRATLDLPGLAPEQARRWGSVLQEAVAQGIPAQADAIAASVRSGKTRTLTDTEHAGLVVASAQAQDAFDRTVREADAAIEAGDPKRAEALRARSDALLDKLDRLTEASDRAGREVARSLNIRKLRLNREAYTLAPVLQQARVYKGGKLSEGESARLTGLVRQVETYEERIRTLESRLATEEETAARKRAATILKREAEQRERSAQREEQSEAAREARTKQVERIREQRQTIKDDLAKLGLRVNDVTGVTAEGSILVGKLALSYAKEGFLSVQDIVARVQQDLPDLSEFEIVQALASPKRKQVPRTEAELDRLRVERRRAQKAVRAAQRALRTPTKTQWLGEIFGTPRALMATGDWSATLRQGAILGTRFPGRAAVAFGKSVRAFGSDYHAERFDLAMREDPRFFEAEASGLYTAPLGDEAAVSSTEIREEQFMSRWAERVPGLGQVMKASERHYITYLNMLRFSAFTHYLDANPDASREQLRAWADFVNVASGRGDLGSFSGAASALSTVFFSPRFMASRFQVGTKAIKYARTPGVNAEIGKTLAAFVGTGMVALTLASLYLDDDEGTVGLDPRESDFGKIVVGDTRIDIWGGEAQVARLLARSALTATDNFGVTDPPPGNREQSPFDLAAQFLQYKLSPAVTVPGEFLTGKNVVGEDVTPGQTALRSTLPLSLTQTVEGAKVGGAKAATAVFLGNWFGVGVDVYDAPLKIRRRRPHPQTGRLPPLAGPGRPRGVRARVRPPHRPPPRPTPRAPPGRRQRRTHPRSRGRPPRRTPTTGLMAYNSAFPGEVTRRRRPRGPERHRRHGRRPRRALSCHSPRRRRARAGRGRRRLQRLVRLGGRRHHRRRRRGRGGEHGGRLRRGRGGRGAVAAERIERERRVGHHRRRPRRAPGGVPRRRALPR